MSSPYRHMSGPLRPPMLDVSPTRSSRPKLLAPRLREHMPPKRAAAAVLGGEPIDPQTALPWGLVNTAIDPDQVMAEALRMARRIAANAPLAVAASKRVMSARRNFGSDRSSAMWEMNDDELKSIMASSDAVEGTIAFAEKRQPVWTGRTPQL